MRFTVNHALMNRKKVLIPSFLTPSRGKLVDIRYLCPLINRSNEEKLATIFDLFHFVNDCAVEEQNIHTLSIIIE